MRLKHVATVRNFLRDKGGTRLEMFYQDLNWSVIAVIISDNFPYPGRDYKFQDFFT
jgi:hypothetical protein